MQHAPIHCLNQMAGGEGDVEEISFIYMNVTSFCRNTPALRR